MAIPYGHGTAVIDAAGAERAAYLRQVLLVTFLGLGWSSFLAVATAAVLAMVGGLLVNNMVFLVLFFGGWAVINFVARPMVYGGGAMKWPGFALGTGVQGVLMGYLLLVATAVSAQAFGNPFLIVGLAAGITFFAGLGMAAFAFTQRRDFSMLGAGLSALALPMLLVMGVGVAFPSLFAGGLGLVVSFAFVAVSVGGLLYNLNKVIHDFNTDQHVEGAYTVTIGLLVLFWNIVSLLMRLSRR